MSRVTLALGIVSGLGIGSWISGHWERRFAAQEAEKQREYTSAGARATRRFQIRFDAYKAASHYLSKHEQWVQFTEPLQGPLPDPPAFARG
ncbi:MAG: hypothetical protein H0U82_03330 [Actinobacteria bacterium]|nr:hypothetical protein [Actinomycetota bacterium]